MCSRQKTSSRDGEIYPYIFVYLILNFPSQHWLNVSLKTLPITPQNFWKIVPDNEPFYIFVRKCISNTWTQLNNVQKNSFLKRQPNNCWLPNIFHMYLYIRVDSIFNCIVLFYLLAKSDTILDAYAHKCIAYMYVYCTYVINLRTSSSPSSSSLYAATTTPLYGAAKPFCFILSYWLTDWLNDCERVCVCVLSHAIASSERFPLRAILLSAVSPWHVHNMYGTCIC